MRIVAKEFDRSCFHGIFFMAFLIVIKILARLSKMSQKISQYSKESRFFDGILKIPFEFGEKSRDGDRYTDTGLFSGTVRGMFGHN